ncbi:MAG: hypothetical protein ACFCVG_18050 [Kineosporiaceae bacterium]
MYLGQHRLTDVLVAWCTGLVWLALVLTAHQALLGHRGRPSGPP